MYERPDLIGKMIVDVDWSDAVQFGEAPSPNEIEAIVFSDGTSLALGGSGQIGVDSVWADMIHDAFPEHDIDALDLLRDIAARDDRPHYLPRVRAILNRIDTALAKVAAPTKED